MEKRGREETHVYRSSWMADGVAPSGKIQKDAQKHYDKHDGHPGGRHKAAGGQRHPGILGFIVYYIINIDDSSGKELLNDLYQFSGGTRGTIS